MTIKCTFDVVHTILTALYKEQEKAIQNEDKDALELIHRAIEAVKDAK